MISHIRDEVVEKKQWITNDELSDIIAVAESTPGPIAINLATYIGYRKSGFSGALVSTFGVVVPAFAVMLIISLFFDSFMSNKYVAYAFEGIKCAVAFLILKAGAEMFLHLPKKAFSLVVFFVSLIALAILGIFSVSFSSLLFIAAGGVAGLLFFIVSNAKGKTR